jgi:rubrerythrin
MSSFFDVREIFQFAVKIEENGEKFYRYAVRIAKDNNVKQMFEYLADEENDHKITFQKILLKIKKYESLETYPGEYAAYLQAYVDNIIFSNLDDERSRVKDALSAIKFGMQRELESILYYQEMKNFTKNQQELIETIIEEERRHFSKLSELKKKYTT